MRKYFKSENHQPIIYAGFVLLGLFLGKSLYKGTSYEQGLLEGTAQKGKLHDILKKVNSYYVDDVDVVELQEKTIQGLLEELDPHSVYINRAQVQLDQDRTNGNFKGIGISYRVVNDTIVTLKAIPGGPSAAAGISAGDKIIEANGVPIVGDSINNDFIRKHLRGEVGSSIDLKVLRGAELKSFSFERGEVPFNSVVGVSLLNKKVGFIKIRHFSKRTYQEFKDAYEMLIEKGAGAFVIDVRDNSGGLMDAVTKICDELLEEGKMIVYTKGRDGQIDYKSSKDGDLSKFPVAILINEYSASASEILAGAIQDNDRGAIIGRRSFGKGLVQNTFKLMDGSKLRLTIARYYTPAGRCIQKPYTNDKAAYLSESELRQKNGELLHQDSIHVDDSLKFETEGGKIVYGGGGIIPDYFIPVDTASFNIHVEAAIINDFDLSFFARYGHDMLVDLQGIPVALAKNTLTEKGWFSRYSKYIEAKLNISLDQSSAALLSGKLFDLLARAKYSAEGVGMVEYQNSAELRIALALFQNIDWKNP